MAGEVPEPAKEHDLGRFHKVRDLTGRAHTGDWNIGGTDLGAVTRMPNGELLCIFGDTFSRDTVGGPGWRSPVGLIGHLDEDGMIRWDRAAGPNPRRAEKFWHYDQGGPAFSTVLPSDVVTVGDSIYLHVMVNQGLGNVLWTEVWESTDNGVNWRHLYKIDGDEDDAQAQLWTWDHAPDEGYVYAYTTKFDRSHGLRMRRIRADRMHEKDAWEKWGFDGENWGWRGHTSVILPGSFGELGLRRLDDGTWVLAMFDAGNYRIDVRVLTHPTANLHTTPVHTVLQGAGWHDEDHRRGGVAQLYGAYIVPGSTVRAADGFQLVLSQWNTETNWPYHSMQFRGTVPDLHGTADTPEWDTPPAPLEAEQSPRPAGAFSGIRRWLRDKLR